MTKNTMRPTHQRSKSFDTSPLETSNINIEVDTAPALQEKSLPVHERKNILSYSHIEANLSPFTEGIKQLTDNIKREGNLFHHEIIKLHKDFKESLEKKHPKDSWQVFLMPSAEDPEESDIGYTLHVAILWNNKCGLFSIHLQDKKISFSSNNSELNAYKNLTPPTIQIELDKKLLEPTLAEYKNKMTFLRYIKECQDAILKLYIESPDASFGTAGSREELDIFGNSWEMFNESEI